MGKKPEQMDIEDAIKKPFIRGPYNYNMYEESKKTGIKCDEGLTRQEFKDDADINVIVRRFNITGQLPTGVRMPNYADFDEVVDFKTAMDRVVEAEHQFAKLPAAVRARFGNDPQELLEFCNDKANLDEARRLGLVPGAPESTQAVEKPKE